MLCDTGQISQVLNIDGKVKRPDADMVKDITGYSIGGVSPIGLPENIGIIMDSALHVLIRFGRQPGTLIAFFQPPLISLKR